MGKILHGLCPSDKVKYHRPFRRVRIVGDKDGLRLRQPPVRVEKFFIDRVQGKVQ